MVFICEHCGYKTTTEGGMRLHTKMTHGATAPVEPSVEAAPDKKNTVSKKSRKQLDVVMDSEEYVKTKMAKLKALNKKWPKRATGLIHGEKISKAEFKKLFPEGTESYIDGRMSKPILLYSKLETSYTIDVKDMKNEWKSIRLTAKKYTISWKEGPIPKKYKVMIPLLRTK